MAAGGYDEAFGHCEKAPADFWAKSGCMARVWFWQGRTGEAIQIFEAAFHRSMEGVSPVTGHLGYAYARTGRRQEAEKLAAGLSPIQQVPIFAGLGDKERTLEALNRSASLGPFRIGMALTSPELALLRGDPRLKALRKKVDLPD
jgi:hypothetical protein